MASLPSMRAPPAVDTTAAPAPGDKVVEWIKSPFDFASFGPRLAVGYAMSRLAQPTKITGELETLRNLIQSPAPLEDKGKLVAAELETIATECLEQGAYVEGDVLRQVKSLLPQELADQIDIPTPPTSAAPSGYEPPVAPLSTSPTPVVTELPDDISLN